MKLTYQNHVDDYELTASESLNGYSVSNLQDPHLSKVWYVLNTTGWFQLDSITGLSPKSVFVAGTNLTDTAVVKIQGNDTDVWTSPSVDETLVRVNDIYQLWGTLESYRYWRVSIEDTANSSLRVGRWWIGDVVEIYGPSLTFTEKYINNSQTFISRSGQSYGNERYSFYAYEMGYPLLDNTERQAIKDFADYVKKSKQFFTSFADKDDCTLGPFYMIQTKDLEFVHLKTLDLWSTAMSFQQTF